MKAPIQLFVSVINKCKFAFHFYLHFSLFFRKDLSGGGGDYTLGVSSAFGPSRPQSRGGSTPGDNRIVILASNVPAYEVSGRKITVTKLQN